MPELAETKKNQGGDGSTLAAVIEKTTERIPYVVVEEEKQPGSRVRFVLKLKEEDIAGRLSDTLKEFNRQVRVPGFRPGKAPQSLVRRQYEPAAREETVRRIIPRLSELFAEERGYEPLTMPILLEWKSTAAEGTTIELAFEIQPNVAVSDETLVGLAAEVHKIKVDDAYLDRAINSLRERNATFEPAEDATYEAKDGLLFDCEVRDIHGEVITDRCATNHYSTKVEDELPLDVAKALVGKKKGDVLEMDIAEEQDDKPGIFENVHYNVLVKEVKKRILPELNDEFAQDVDEKFQTLADLRADLQKRAADAEAKREEEEALAGIYSQLRERLEFDLPRALVENDTRESLREMEGRLNNYGFSLNQMDQSVVNTYVASMKEQAKVKVKNSLILRSIGKFLNLSPSEEDIKGALENIAKQTNRKPLAIRAHLEKNKQWSGFLDDLTVTVTNKELIKRAQLNHKEVTVEEWEAHVKQQQADQAAKLRGA